jgi:hypothetical protein
LVKDAMVEQQQGELGGTGRREVVEKEVKALGVEQGQFQTEALGSLRLHGSVQIETLEAVGRGQQGLDPASGDAAAHEGKEATATFIRLATNATYRDEDDKLQQKTDWHNIVVWGNAAEMAGATLQKGSHIYLEGSLRTRSYEREHKASKRKVKISAYATEVVVRDIRPLCMEPITSDRDAA